MNRRLVISLAPLLATAAFAVTPTEAQAAPHDWFSNGVLIPEGEKVPTVSWGTLAFESAAGHVECKNVIAGYVENPLGGGAGKGAVQNFAPYECSSTCPVEIEVIAEGLPWPTELVERNGKIKDQTKRAKLRFQCVFEGTALLNTAFKGNSDPEPKNGTAAGKPSEDRYLGTGEEELENPETGPIGADGVKTEGKLKTQGYNATELITDN
jgi:hypothetical protein